MSIEGMQVVFDVMLAHSADSRPAEATSIPPQFHDSSGESNGRQLNQVFQEMESTRSTVMNNLPREIVAIDFGHT
ncbi:hypothetical protein N7516_001773 [Penicillium verrucosum]|uniref:uncharacterized protein n=1 Tax=Penicillium verrucosum TaxID=60171 RepID=UPI0025453A81|nr:uncharacterized protein N7516_001773 [Penicillium verrucosum]KAJ5941605.1 hypothetical protein N7516_001773 [Penicillium verrucosum]